MKSVIAALKKKKSVVGLLVLFLIAANTWQIFAHGGEDHGDAKPKTETTDKGTVSHSARLGDLEVMLKHPLFLPDTATSARLFVTKFETNEGFEQVSTAIEIESANGSLNQATIEKTESAGIFNVNFPALPNGIYTIRTKLTHGGETDTTTFSGIEVKPAPIVSTDSGEMSWARTILITFIFSMILALFAALIYFVLRFSEGRPITEEIVSA